MTNKDNPGNQLRQLRGSFTARLPEQINEILLDWQKFQSQWDVDTANRLVQELHKLAGASLSLGFIRLGISAQTIENTLKDLRKRIEINEPISFSDVYQAINEKMDLLLQISSSSKLEKPNILNNASSESINAVPSLQDSRANRLIYLVEDDPNQAQEISQQIGYFGYSVKQMNQLAEILITEFDPKLPTTILMDVVFPEGESAGANAIQVIRQKLPPNVHVIFISVRDDISTRLKAARAGGKAYFPKPINIGVLVEVLDRLMSIEKVLPYRILIVDDDTIQASVNALHLKQAAIEAHIITDPLLIFQALNEFNPDLILLDMYMPECSGMDLAVVIRQMETYVSIPIVYLSSETDRERQLEAVGLGGDDFLTKPIKPEHLIASVSSRIMRYRQLRFLMMRDSLTGLFNHTSLKERYAQEFNRAIRLNLPMAYAMIDLDNFKKVNDTFGHSAGDRVIKSLASMLGKRLRNTDIIGRYGGEEFAIVLPNTNGEEAACLLEELRAGFEHIHHLANNQEFLVTFSCGIAAYPQNDTPLDLVEAADKALYSAKRLGKNRVLLAGQSIGENEAKAGAS